MRLSTEAFPIFDQERRSLMPAIRVKLQRERVQTKQPTHQHRPAAFIGVHPRLSFLLVSRQSRSRTQGKG
jgi:hypothetical protein